MYLQKVFVDALKVADEIAGSGSESGSISKKYESADRDPYKNFMDPQPWIPCNFLLKK
jgi:hypothetical protein